MKMNKITTRKPWSDKDVKQVMKLYCKFLASQTTGEIYVKALPVRELAAKLERTKSSIECKMMNISAVLQDNHLPIVQGYKALSNYNKLLADQVAISFPQINS